jgi:hypothetical protein
MVAGPSGTLHRPMPNEEPINGPSVGAAPEPATFD